MKIDKNSLKTLWYEDKEGKKIPYVEGMPKNAAYQVSNFPLEVRETHLKLIKQEEVAACKHKRKNIRRTDGWIKGIKGRECKCCYGTQVRKWWQPWGRKWDAYGSRKVFESSVHLSNATGKLLVAMVNSGDYTLAEAILVYSKACERCANVLWHKYTQGKEGYEEYSEEWNKSNTNCIFCSEN